VEASALQAPGSLARHRVSLGTPLLRLRSDDQLVALFRAGNDDAFRVIHDRYRHRLLAYTRQMLPSSRQDAEDALQDVFLKAYAGLRANNRDLALRAWLYRVAHNRCVDLLRRPPAAIALDELPGPAGRGLADPVLIAEQREMLASLIVDVQRLPEQQRSALLMRELSGMSYADLAAALGISIPAVKSLLVRARVSLTKASEARNTMCVDIRRELVECHDRGVRATGTARRHLRDCASCREFRRDVRTLSRRFSVVVPAFGPIALITKLAGLGGGGVGGGSAAAGTGVGGSAAAVGGTAALGGAGAAGGAGTALGGGAAIAGGTCGVTAAAGGGALSAGHFAALVAAALVTAGGAVALHGAPNDARHGGVHRAPRALSAGARPADSATDASRRAHGARVATALGIAHSRGGRSATGTLVAAGVWAGVAGSQLPSQGSSGISATTALGSGYATVAYPGTGVVATASGTSASGCSTVSGASAGPLAAPSAPAVTPRSVGTAGIGSALSTGSASESGTAAGTGSGSVGGSGSTAGSGSGSGSVDGSGSVITSGAIAGSGAAVSSASPGGSGASGTGGGAVAPAAAGGSRGSACSSSSTIGGGAARAGSATTSGPGGSTADTGSSATNGGQSSSVTAAGSSAASAGPTSASSTAGVSPSSSG
jgi:RNA polymerase sigma factor (sigma-70 family)